MNNKTDKVSQSEGAHAGVGMDRIIEKKKNPFKVALWAGAGLAVAILLYSLINDVGGGRTFKVNENRLVISSVTTGTFEDFIPVRGRVTPLKTVFLDAVAGGRVERILIEDGNILIKGQQIIELSNPNLQLNVMNSEAAVTEQLSRMQDTELRLEQNRLGHKKTLVNLDYQIKKLTRDVERNRILYKQNNIIKSKLEMAEDELDYNIKMRALTVETQAADQRMQVQQLKFLQSSGKRLERSLKVARNNLDQLNMKAPVGGKLSGFNLEVGQNIKQGERVGQVDDPDNFKLRANIDEFYLGRVDLGQTATFERGGRNFDMKIAKIYPDVENGQFEIDLVFLDETPADIRRGQTIQTKLTLGDANMALLIPNGAFYQDTGGSWLFVVGPDGQLAIKRSVKLGRRNSRFIEVLDGLELGERVVTSPYTSFKEMDRLKLSAE